MTPELLLAAKNVSIWALAVLVIVTIAGAVLKQHEKSDLPPSDTKPGGKTSAKNELQRLLISSRLQYFRIGAGLLFALLVSILVVTSALQPRVGWAPLKQLGDWFDYDTACTETDTPQLSVSNKEGKTQILCDDWHIGQVAVCWGDRLGTANSAGIYPQGSFTEECQGKKSWCTYKSEQALPLASDKGASPGKVFICAQLLR